MCLIAACQPWHTSNRRTVLHSEARNTSAREQISSSAYAIRGRAAGIINHIVALVLTTSNRYSGATVTTVRRERRRPSRRKSYGMVRPIMQYLSATKFDRRLLYRRFCPVVGGHAMTLLSPCHSQGDDTKSHGVFLAMPSKPAIVREHAYNNSPPPASL